MIQISLADSRLTTFVEQQTKDPFYYSQAWLDLITKLYGYPLTLLTTTNTAGQITGFLPLCSLQSRLTGRRLVALPFSDNCPLLAVDAASTNDLIDQAIQLAQQQKAKYLELRTGVNDVLTRRSDLRETNLYVRWQMPLDADPHAMWSSLRKAVQKRVKRSKRLGVQVRIA